MFRSLHARSWMAVVTSLLSGGVALVIGARHLLQLHAVSSADDPSFVRAVWMTMVCVVLVANVGGLAVVLFTTQRVRAQLDTMRHRVLSLAQLPTTPYATSGGHVSPADEFADVEHAIEVAREELHLAHSRMRMESDRNRAIIETVFASVFAVDGGGRILSANPAAVRLFALPSGTLEGVVLSDLLAADSLRMAVDDVGSVTFTGAEHERRFTTRIRLFGRRSFPAEVAVTPLALDGQRAWAVFVHDLTEKEQVETALADARLAADAANRAKTAFLARMSHELRTPLNSMIGFTKIVRRSRSSQLSDRDRHYLDRVQVGSEHLLVLVSDILDLSHIESGTIALQLESIDVSPIVQDILARHEELVADRPMVLEVALPEVAALATVDATRLRQVLTNLIGNAVKFTARGSVQVSVQLNHETGRASAVVVRDTGIGIPLDRQAHIFESFEQGGQEMSHRYGGTGLGLALSRRIAQQMGCMLSVESIPGAGSTFTLAFGQVDVVPASVSRVFRSDAA
ncbi:MAG: PAS domain S-box protein [Gemmatimonadaceae bacterium]|nr:PAS domain S-box protein [Gemmatimonadaceae bacterium]